MLAARSVAPTPQSAAAARVLSAHGDSRRSPFPRRPPPTPASTCTGICAESPILAPAPSHCGTPSFALTLGVLTPHYTVAASCVLRSAVLAETSSIIETLVSPFTTKVSPSRLSHFTEPLHMLDPYNEHH